MRKILLLVFGGTIVLFGCSKNGDGPASIQGTWTANRVVAITYLNNVVSSSDTVTTGTIQFDANGNFSSVDSSGTSTGTYTYDASTKQLTVVSDGDTTHANVTNLTSTNLHFTADETTQLSGYTVRLALDADYKR